DQRFRAREVGLGVGGLGLGTRRFGLGARRRRLRRCGNRFRLQARSALGKDHRMRGSETGGKRFRSGHARMESHPSPSASKSVSRSRLAATSPVGVSSRCRTTTGFKNALSADADLPSLDVEVIDPAHPLCGKRFRLISIERTTCPDTWARVEWRFGLTLLLPLHVTNLGPRRERPAAQTKLSIEALEELVAVAEG